MIAEKDLNSRDIERKKLFTGICLALLPTVCTMQKLRTPFVYPGRRAWGSHPHLAYEFVSAIVDDRNPYPNAVQSANWTCVGLLAHASSMNGRKIKKLPEFTLEEK